MRRSGAREGGPACSLSTDHPSLCVATMIIHVWWRSSELRCSAWLQQLALDICSDWVSHRGVSLRRIPSFLGSAVPPPKRNLNNTCLWYAMHVYCTSASTKAPPAWPKKKKTAVTDSSVIKTNDSLVGRFLRSHTAAPRRRNGGCHAS